MSVRASSAALACGVLMTLGVAPATAQIPPAAQATAAEGVADPSPQMQDDPLAPVAAQPETAERHRPGRTAAAPAPIRIDPDAVIPPQLQDLYGCEPSLSGGGLYALSPCTPPVPDRWRLATTLGLVHPRLTDPYNQNVLKGDLPIFGSQDWFFIASLVSDTVIEPRSFPVPVGTVASERAGSNDPFGRSDSFLLSQTVLASAEFVQGSTAFKPQVWDVKLTLGFNLNFATSPERQILSVKSTDGTTRTDGFVGVQEAFVERHLRDVSERYDFDSLRIGVQPFSVDFRGFLFQDDQAGVRLFGDRDGNRWQYNLAVFDRLDKDANSGLNDITSPRKDYVFVANLYRQDLPRPGFTSQVALLYNMNREGSEFERDTDGFPVRPALLGDDRGRDYDVVYLGYNGDGRFGRVNLTTSFYYALGQDRDNPFTGRAADISAFFLAAEPSYDFSYLRVRGSALYASGESHPNGGTEHGFDAVLENPQFAGADTSYWIRQAIPFIGGGQAVSLVGRNGVLPDLRTSKDQGQSNFINPGLLLLGVGTDADILPTLRVSGNVNHLDFAQAGTLEVLRHQGDIGDDIGWDLSTAVIWRPKFTQNVVLRLSGAALLPGGGFKDLFDNAQQRDVYYSVLFNAVFTY